VSIGGAGSGSGGGSIGVWPGGQGQSQFGLGIETYGKGSVTPFGKSLSFWRYSVHATLSSSDNLASGSWVQSHAMRSPLRILRNMLQKLELDSLIYISFTI